MDRMEIIGHLTAQSNVPCITCEKGDTCQMSVVPLLFGQEAKASADKCVRVEDQAEVLQEAQLLGHLIGSRLDSMNSSLIQYDPRLTIPPTKVIAFANNKYRYTLSSFDCTINSHQALIYLPTIRRLSD
ncbi:MAG: hypothetical protein SVY53_07535 [Chloroflexota bacterium]|nr:hypothetical protein [Chloroflexota bacterium]